MQQKKKRENHSEFSVLCFVPAEKHAQYGADTAANKGEGKQDGFGNAPRIFSGAILIRSHCGKCYDIDYNKINNEIVYSKQRKKR